MDRAFKKRMRPGDAVRQLTIREIAVTSYPMMMAASMQFAIGQTGVIMLGIYRPEADVGYYAVAVKLATLSAFIVQAINASAAPKFSELHYSGKGDDLRHVARKSAKLVFWTTAPLLFSLVLVGNPLLRLFFGEEFQAAYPAMMILVVGQLFTSAAGSTTAFMSMTGHQHAMKNILFVAAALHLALGFLLIPRFGTIGAAAANMASLIYWTTHMMLHVRKKCGLVTGYVPSFMLRERP